MEKKRTEQPENRKKIALIVILAIALFIVINVFGFRVFASRYYHALEGANVSPYEDVAVEILKGNGYNGYFYDGPGTEDAVIFYPGGKVESAAYGQLMISLAHAGVDGYLITMPYNFAFFGSKAAKYLQQDYGSLYDHWYLAGHSLGGAIASYYAYYHKDVIDGMIYLASYGTKDLTDATFDVLLIYGSKDGVMNMDNYEKNKANLPAGRYTEVIIDGGNHAGFALYGPQSGDNDTDIDPDTQRQKAVDAMLQFMKIKVVAD